MRALVEKLSRLTVRIFFRHIEILGQENVPTKGPVILAINHPNGLVDPLCILANAPRNVSFLAKAPLFHTPLIKHFVVALECLPVYRKQDGNDTSQNIKTLQAARELLAAGGAIALFPEGISHDKPQLQSLKTGAARIALGAQSLLAENDAHSPAVQLIPAGLYYSSRGIFRSNVVLIYGCALEVEAVELDGEANPPKETVMRLTRKLADSLRSLTLNAQDSELITLAVTAARLIDKNTPGPKSADNTSAVQRRLSLTQQILAGHEILQHTDSDKAAALVERLRRYESLVNRNGLTANGTQRPDTGLAVKHVMVSTISLLALAPLIGLGMLENFLPYQVVGHLALHLTGDKEDILSSHKVIAGLVLFPATWLIVTAAVWWLAGPYPAAVHLLLAPLLAWAALWFMDRAAVTIAGARILWLYWLRPKRYAQLHEEGRAIAEQLLAVNSN